jgi:hypothetical protein
MVATLEGRPPAAGTRQVVGGGAAEHRDDADGIDQQRAQLQPVAARRDQRHQRGPADRTGADSNNVDDAVCRQFVAAEIT